MQLFIEVTDQDTRFLDPSWAKLKGWLAGCQKELRIRGVRVLGGGGVFDDLSTADEAFTQCQALLEELLMN